MHQLTHLAATCTASGWPWPACSAQPSAYSRCAGPPAAPSGACVLADDLQHAGQAAYLRGLLGAR